MLLASVKRAKKVRSTINFSFNICCYILRSRAPLFMFFKTAHKHTALKHTQHSTAYTSAFVSISFFATFIFACTAIYHNGWNMFCCSIQIGSLSTEAVFCCCSAIQHSFHTSTRRWFNKWASKWLRKFPSCETRNFFCCAFCVVTSPTLDVFI